MRAGLAGRALSYSDARFSRDFVYVDDVCEAFVRTALNLRAEHYGASFNIGSGVRTTLEEIAALAQELFALPEPARFGAYPHRIWDQPDWYANPRRAAAALDWRSTVTLREGLARTRDWTQAQAAVDPSASIRRKAYG